MAEIESLNPIFTQLVSEYEVGTLPRHLYPLYVTANDKLDTNAVAPTTILDPGQRNPSFPHPAAHPMDMLDTGSHKVTSL